MAGIIQTLGDFVREVGQDQHRPQQKWLFNMLFGMFVSRSTMLSEIGRALDEETPDGEPRELNHTEKRLSRNLNSDRLDDQALAARYLTVAERFTKVNDGAGVVCAVDYTDIHKPRAKETIGEGMEGVCRCWNGSDGKITTGLPVVQVEAHLENGNQLPLVLHPFSYHEPGMSKGSQHKIFLERIEEAAPHVGALAWWTFDRGFDSARIFTGMDLLGCRWIVRLQINVPAERNLILADDRCVSVSDAALETIPRYKFDVATTRRERKLTGKKTKTIEIGARRVFLTNQKNKPSPLGPARTLLVVWGFGKAPMVFLVSEHLGGRAAILEAFHAYGRRWKCELATRSMKESRSWGVRLEDVRALTLRGIRRLVTLAALLYVFMATLRADGGALLQRAERSVRTFAASPDPRYRIFRGLGDMLRRAVRGALRL